MPERFEIKSPQNHSTKIVVWRCSKCGALVQMGNPDRLPIRWIQLMPDNEVYCSLKCFESSVDTGKRRSLFGGR